MYELCPLIYLFIFYYYLSSIARGVVAQSPEPGAHVLNARAFRIELEFRNVGFCGEGKTGVPGEKPRGAEKRTNNKLNPHMTSSPGIEPGPHWWKASALTTAPSLLPCNARSSCSTASDESRLCRHRWCPLIYPIPARKAPPHPGHWWISSDYFRLAQVLLQVQSDFADFAIRYNRN